MRVLILGGGGMLGHKVFQVLSKDFQTFATFRDFIRYPVYADVDEDRIINGINALHFKSVTRAFARVKPKPRVVINCIGIVKQLEQDPLTSIGVNSLFPHRLAEFCAAKEARLLHVSTDCVFSGDKGNYTEKDIPDARDLYGRSKLLGEVEYEHCLTLRTSIIGRDFARTHGLLEWFLAHRGGRVNGYTHALYTGFTTQALATIMGDLIMNYPNLSGLHHVSSNPISKYHLLVKIRDAMGLDIKIEPQDFRCDRSLDSSRFRSRTGCYIPGWDKMVTELAQDNTPYDEWREQHATR